MADRILWSRMQTSHSAADTTGAVRSFRGGGFAPQYQWLRARRSAGVETARYSQKSRASRSAGAETVSRKNQYRSSRSRRTTAHGSPPGGRGNTGSASASQPRNQTEGTPGSTRRIRVVRKVVLIASVAAAAIIAGEVMFQTILAPNLAINRIRLRGDSVIPQSELREIAGLSGTMLYFHIDTDAISARLENVPEVSEASVRTEFPDTLTIDIAARKPLAVTHLSEDGRSVPAVLDEEGVVFRKGLGANEYDLPVISGLRLEGFEAGDTLPDELTRLFAELGNLRIDSPDLFEAVSEIRIVRRAGEYETVVYPTYASVPIRMPARVEAERYEAALHAVEALDRRGELASVDEIDMRSGDVVYTRDAED